MKSQGKKGDYFINHDLDNWEVGDTLIHLNYGKAQHSLDRKQFSECQSLWMSDCRGAYMQKSRKGDLRITSPILS